MKKLLSDAEKEIEDFEYEIKNKSPYRFISPPTTDEEKIKIMEQAE
jgi:hypothetical protein